MLNEARYHILVEIDKKHLNDLFEEISASLLEIIKSLRKLGTDVTEIQKLRERYRSRLRRLDKSINREFAKIGILVIQNVVSRYFNFDKLDGNPVGDTGRLEQALANPENIKVEITKNKAVMGIMDKRFLTQQTANSRGPLPYYIYQQQAIQPGGPRYFRYFITVADIGREQAREEDERLIRIRLQSFLEKELASV